MQYIELIAGIAVRDMQNAVESVNKLHAQLVAACGSGMPSVRLLDKVNLEQIKRRSVRPTRLLPL
jgi:hypothetical protein